MKMEAFTTVSKMLMQVRMIATFMVLDSMAAPSFWSQIREGVADKGEAPLLLGRRGGGPQSSRRPLGSGNEVNGGDS